MGERLGSRQAVIIAGGALVFLGLATWRLASLVDGGGPGQGGTDAAALSPWRVGGAVAVGLALALAVVVWLERKGLLFGGRQDD